MVGNSYFIDATGQLTQNCAHSTRCWDDPFQVVHQPFQITSFIWDFFFAARASVAARIGSHRLLRCVTSGV